MSATESRILSLISGGSSQGSLACLRRDFPYSFRHENMWDKPFSKGTYFFCWLLTFAKQLWWVWDEFPSWTWSNHFHSFSIRCWGHLFGCWDEIPMDWIGLAVLVVDSGVSSDPELAQVSWLCFAYVFSFAGAIFYAVQQTKLFVRANLQEVPRRGTGIGTGRQKMTAMKQDGTNKPTSRIKSPWRLVFGLDVFFFVCVQWDKSAFFFAPFFSEH